MPIIRDIWGTRYVRAGIFFPSKFYKFCESMGCLIVIGILIFFMFLLYKFILYSSLGITAVISPNQYAMNNDFYQFTLSVRHDEFVESTMIKMENDFWKENLHDKNIGEIRTTISSVSDDILKKKNLHKNDFWFKNTKHSEYQETRMLTTTIYDQSGHQMRNDRFETIEIKRCVYLLMDMNSKRNGLFMEYKLIPKKAVVFDSNVDENYIINTKKF